MTNNNPKAGIFYGYIVLGSCFITSFSYGLFYTLGVFFKPLEAEFGWNATLISSVQSLHFFIFVVSTFLVGWSTDTFGPRFTVGWGGTLIGIGFLCCSFTRTICQFYVFYGIASLGAGIIWSLPTATIQRWFVRGRGITLGIVASGIGCGTLCLAPIANHLIENYGWRTSYVTCGIGIWVMLMTSAFFMRGRPEDIAQTHLALKTEVRNAKVKEPKHGSKIFTNGERSLKETLRTPVFWFITAQYFFSVLPLQLAMLHVVPFAISIGISGSAASAILGLIGGFSILGRLIMGWSAEKLGWKRSLLICLLACMIIFLWLAAVSKLWMLLVFAVVYGFFYGGKTPLTPGLVGFYFYGRSLGTLIGIAHAISLVGGAVGPILGGIVYDATGNYNVAFVIGSALWGISATLLMLVKVPLKANRCLSSSPISG